MSNNNNNSNTKQGFNAFGLLLTFFSLAGIFNFIIFYIFGAKAKSKDFTLFGHVYLGGFFIFSLYGFVGKHFHPFFIFIFYLLVAAAYILGILISISCIFNSYYRISLLKELDEFTLNNKDISIMSDDEIKNLIDKNNPQAVSKQENPVISDVMGNLSDLETDISEPEEQQPNEPKIIINSLSPEELLSIPFFNTSFVEEAVSNRKHGFFFNNMEDLKNFLHIDDKSASILENLIAFDIPKNPYDKRILDV